MSLTDYPTAVDTFSVKKNNIDLYDAVHMNKVQEAVVALETLLGVSSGSSSTVASKARRFFTKVVATDGSGDYQTDGTNDEEQIQAAIAAVIAAGGGTVVIRAGTYTLGDGITVGTAGVNIIGEGMSATILKFTSGVATQKDILTFSANYCSASDLTVDGNKANNTLDHRGLVATGSYCVFSKIEARNINESSTRGQGFRVTGSYISLFGCSSHDNDGEGFSIGGTYNSFVGCNTYSSEDGFDVFGTYAQLANCTATGTSTGFSLGGTIAALTGCVSSANDVGFDIYGILNSAFNCLAEDNVTLGFWINGRESTINGCQAAGNGNDGIFIDGDDNVVTGCTIDASDLIAIASGLAANDTYSGIYLVAGAVRNIISGNRILNTYGGFDYAYGIREASAAADRNVITSNIATDSITAQISVQGVNSVSANNVIT